MQAPFSCAAGVGPHPMGNCNEDGVRQTDVAHRRRHQRKSVPPEPQSELPGQPQNQFGRSPGAALKSAAKHPVLCCMRRRPASDASARSPSCPHTPGNGKGIFLPAPPLLSSHSPVGLGPHSYVFEVIVFIFRHGEVPHFAMRRCAQWRIEFF